MLSSLYFLLLLTADGFAKLIHIKERRFNILYTNMTKKNVPNAYHCEYHCKMTRLCVGGRFNEGSKLCDLQLDRRQRMVYNDSQQVNDDYVFGMYCDPSVGYEYVRDAYIQVENHEDIKTDNLTILMCTAICDQRDWCLSADIDPPNRRCYLSSHSSTSARLITNYVRYPPLIHAEKICVKETAGICNY